MGRSRKEVERGYLECWVQKEEVTRGNAACNAALAAWARSDIACHGMDSAGRVLRVNAYLAERGKGGGWPMAPHCWQCAYHVELVLEWRCGRWRCGDIGVLSVEQNDGGGCEAVAITVAAVMRMLLAAPLVANTTAVKFAMV